jgi:hypothetical protein
VVLTIRRTCSGVGGGLEDDAPCLGGVDGLFPEDIKRWAAKDAGLQNIYDRRFSKCDAVAPPSRSFRVER